SLHAALPILRQRVLDGRRSAGRRGRAGAPDAGGRAWPVPARDRTAVRRSGDLRPLARRCRARVGYGPWRASRSAKRSSTAAGATSSRRPCRRRRTGTDSLPPRRTARGWDGRPRIRCRRWSGTASPSTTPAAPEPIASVPAAGLEQGPAEPQALFGRGLERQVPAGAHTGGEHPRDPRERERRRIALRVRERATPHHVRERAARRVGTQLDVTEANAALDEVEVEIVVCHLAEPPGRPGELADAQPSMQEAPGAQRDPRREPRYAFPGGHPADGALIVEQQRRHGRLQQV